MTAEVHFPDKSGRTAGFLRGSRFLRCCEVQREIEPCLLKATHCVQLSHAGAGLAQLKTGSKRLYVVLFLLAL